MRAASTCLLLALLLAAGCGGDDQEQPDRFATDYNAAIRRLADVNQELAGLGTASRSTRAIAAEFDRFGDALQGARGELAGLKPPLRATPQFDALLAALDDSVGASRRAAAAARAIRPARQRRALRQLRRATRGVDAAQDALGRAVATTG